MEVLHCGNRDFRLSCSCPMTLTLTFVYELDAYSFKMYCMTKLNFLSLRQGCRTLSHYKHTVCMVHGSWLRDYYHADSPVVKLCF